MLLTLNRKTHRAYNRVREGNFSLRGLMGFGLHGKTVGVIGSGKIGKAFVRIMQGFGCHILAYDPYPDQELLDEGIRFCELPELLENSTIVSLHCPLTPQTHHLIGEKEFDLLPSDAVLINTGRGKLIDTKAAIQALKTHRIGGLGLDVYEEEEELFFEDHSNEILSDDVFARLLTFPNVLITGHQGFFTQEAIESIARTTADNLQAFDQTGTCENLVTQRS